MHPFLKFMLALVSGGVFVTIWTSPPSSLSLVNEARELGLLTEMHREQIEEVMPLIVAGTRFEGEWSVNSRHQRGRLSVYLLAPGFWDEEGVSQELQSIRNNCAHVGDGVVFCDIWFLSTFLERRRLRHSLFGIDGRSSHFRTFLMWILAHEVAHAVEGHGGMHFHAPAFEEAVENPRALHRFEFQADKHLVALLENDVALQRDLLLLFSDLLHAESYYQMYNTYPTPSEFADGTIGLGIDVMIKDSRTHPDFVVRILRILQLAAERDDPGNHLLREDVDRAIERLRRDR